MLIGRTKITIGSDFSYQSLCRHRSIQKRTVADIEHIPFKDNSFDLVSANMVMEHIQNPKAALTEITRVLKPGGLFIFHTVNYRNYLFRLSAWAPQALKNKLIWILEGRKEEDVFPVAYRFNTPKEVVDESMRCGLDIREISLLNSTPATALLGPLAIPELLITKALEYEAARDYRANIIGVLQKPDLPAQPAFDPERRNETTFVVR
jgi:SAM-dependent methyltransferase